MEYFGYKLRIANEYFAILYKHYENNEMPINQVMQLSFRPNGKHIASVELSVSDTYIDQKLLDTLQIALNRTKRDIQEHARTIVRTMNKRWEIKWNTY